MFIGSVLNNYTAKKLSSPKFGVNEEYKKYSEARGKAQKRAADWGEFSLAAFVMGFIFMLPPAISKNNRFTKSKTLGMGLLAIALGSQFYNWFLLNKYYKEERAKLDITK